MQCQFPRVDILALRGHPLAVPMTTRLLQDPTEVTQWRFPATQLPVAAYDDEDENQVDFDDEGDDFDDEEFADEDGFEADEDREGSFDREVEEEEEPAPKRPVRQPVRTSEPTEPARQPDAGVRRPVPRQAPAPAAASAGAPSADLSELREMILLIGKTGDARDVVLKKLSAAVENLTEKIEAIDGYLAFRYSEEAGPGNEIKSLTEVSWR